MSSTQKNLWHCGKCRVPGAIVSHITCDIILGMITQDVNVSVERTLSDDQLVERLADGDPKKALLIRAMLGSDDSFVQYWV